MTEASVRTAVVNATCVRWNQEHRIEVATAPLAPMKIVRPPRYDFRGQSESPKTREAQRSGWVSRPASTAEREQAGWHPVPPAPQSADEFFAFGADPAAAARAPHPDALYWLLEREDGLPLWARDLRLTFESGFVHLVLGEAVNPEYLVGVVDTAVGMLDLMLAARPRHPASTS